MTPAIGQVAPWPEVACRACGRAVVTGLDLGPQPPTTSFPLPTERPTELFPLRVGTCVACGLAQLSAPGPPDADDPRAPSPLSSATIRAHARELIGDLARRGLASPTSRILTLASHGGHLGPLLRDEGFASRALEGSKVRVDQLLALGQEALLFALGETEPIPAVARGAFDLVIDLYLINHLERPRRALEQIAELLVPRGTLVIEYDDVTANVRGGYWDSIGRSHPVYPTLTWLDRELSRVGLTLFDAFELPLYGGAMQVYARAGERRGRSVAALLEREAATGMGLPAGLAPMAKAVALARRDVVGHLRDAREEGRRIAGYGAPARAITFLNALGIGPALLPYVVDRSADKHGRVIPGVGVPILPPARLLEDQPDEVLVLAWTLAAEVCPTLRQELPRTRLLVAMPVLADVTDPEGHVEDVPLPRGVR